MTVHSQRRYKPKAELKKPRIVTADGAVTLAGSSAKAATLSGVLAVVMTRKPTVSHFSDLSQDENGHYPFLVRSKLAHNLKSVLQIHPREDISFSITAAEEEQNARVTYLHFRVRLPRRPFLLPQSSGANKNKPALN